MSTAAAQKTRKEFREYTETSKSVIVPKHHYARAWAAKNAYLLIFLSGMFFITWIVNIVIGVFYGSP